VTYLKKISIFVVLLVFCNISFQKLWHDKSSLIFLKPPVELYGMLHSNKFLISDHIICQHETCHNKVILKPNSKRPEKNYDNKYCYFLISDIKSDWYIHHFNTHWDIRNNTFPLVHLLDCCIDNFRTSYYLSHDIMHIQHRLQV
jgi:hypothetical protein